jgi:biotin-(acetyl-CoA carboxylase) ligase
LAAQLLQNLAHWHDLRLAQGFAPIRDAWLRHAAAMGAPVSVKRDGALIEGGLLLAKANEVQLILAGEII